MSGRVLADENYYRNCGIYFSNPLFILEDDMSSSLAGAFLRYQKIYGKKAIAQVAGFIDERLLPEEEIAKILDVGKPPDETLRWLTDEIYLDGESALSPNYSF